MNHYTPQEIVDQLDKYIVGQNDAKKAVAVALRNRYRRQLLPTTLQEDIIPKNIIMIGPTGVGKTEIARRMAKLVKAPFIKVEATKFTEVGYVGRDAESIIRELLETAIRMEKTQRMANVREEAEQLANEKIIDILTNPAEKPKQPNPFGMLFNTSAYGGQTTTPAVDESLLAKRETLRQQLYNNELERMVIEIEVADKSASIQLLGNSGLEEMGINLGDMFGNLLPTKKKKRRVTISEARRIFAQEEAENLLDMDHIVKEAIKQTEQRGIVFLDEIDKIAVKSAGKSGPDVSREGVQRDILPIVEGTTVVTKHGPVKTDYILFIAAGAFHVATPADLIPELQGRFPIRVELESLSQEDLERILTEPKNSLVKQYTALLGTEKIIINFTKEAISELAAIACHVNLTNENIGARRLHTIMEKLLEDLSFKAPELAEQEITIDTTYVRERLSNIAGNEDMSRYIL